MAAILLKIFSAVMSVVVTLSSTFPAFFGNKVFLDPAENLLIIDGSFYSVGYFEEPTVISDFETAKNIFKEDEFGGINANFFEKYNLVFVSVTLPSSSYKVFVNSIAENGDMVEIGYNLVNDRCVGATVISSTTICVSVSKNIENVKLSESDVFVPFCIHK